MLFILTFLLVYLGMHCFTWVRFSGQFGFSSRVRRGGFLLCLLLALSPVAAHLVPLSWPEPVVYVIWQAVFTWLGVIFYLFLLQLALFLLELIIWPVMGKTGPGFSRRAAFAIITITIITVGWGFMEAAGPVRVTEYEMSSPKIDNELRVAFFSDTHLGVQKSMQRVKDLKRLVQAQDPDLIILGGDILNDHLEWLQEEARIMEGMQADLGKYAVLGNHEFYAGAQGSREFFARAGFSLLEDETEKISGTNIKIIGVSDPAPYRKFRQHQENVTRQLTSSLDPDNYNILVSHRPWGFEIAQEAGVDLQLAGHTHKGQIFPFRFFVRLKYDHVYGLRRLKGSSLIVPSGAGSWGPPIRVLAPPEIVLVKISPGGIN
ncbi:metallophosphoesterase [Desulfonatronospira sp.]|uniref:metallophosphoesterase n=1 Tax=Desulfonatronospira sp. TaxID=1962951 RepID=UPI0025C6F127|nr:metallophosphoesterase [Desulfonatronospira sp.]